ncbi:MAG TPA: hypothetical protein VKZ18_13445 [Polyangia bacterium]|nr:hypothetical protein [Polyangia bacterium]
MKPRWFALALLAICLPTTLAARAAHAATAVCVSVEQKSWYRPASPPAPSRVAPAPHAAPSGTAPGSDAPAAPLSTFGPVPPPAPPAPPPAPTASGGDAAKGRAAAHEIDPTVYLKRMIEYEVTHEPGFAAVEQGCQQHLVVELYQLESGWTVFARYAEREEKVDHAQLDEFRELAQRLAYALLRNRSIAQTITRENVLRSDSERDLRTVEGSGHFIFGMGTEVRVAELPTAQGQSAPVANELRVLTPVSVEAGYRYKLHSWGFDAFGRVGIGTEQTGANENDLGGHVDYSWSLSAGLHFLRYLDAPGINSLYFGGGAAFELAFFEVIQPVATYGTTNSRATLVGGGLNVDLFVGYEFLRASSIHFFGQIEIDAPTYLLKTENDAGAINTYMPGALAQIGIIF